MDRDHAGAGSVPSHPRGFQGGRIVCAPVGPILATAQCLGSTYNKAEPMTADTQFWDNLAERYASKPVANIPVYHRKLAITKERLTKTDVVLDIGCGTGSLALELAPLVSQVHAADSSREMVKICERKATAANVDNATFHHGTLEALSSFSPESFDCICAYNILHLVDDRTATLQRVATLLKPGGLLVSSTPCLGGSWVPMGFIVGVMRWFGKAPRVHMLSVDGLREELQQAGFVDLTAPEIGAPERTAFFVATKPVTES